MSIRELNAGMSGPDVRAVQQALNSQVGLNPQLAEDGVFGKNTDAKVRAFQEARRLSVDGIVGKDTRRALFPIGVATATIVVVKQPKGDFRRPPSPPIDSSLPGSPRWRADAALGAAQDYVNTPTGGQDVAPVDIPGAMRPVYARFLPDHILGFDYDHLELVPGGQHTLSRFTSFGPYVDAASLTLQSIYQRGPDDGHNRTITMGGTMTAPVTWFGGDDGPWTLSPFVQVTDVDWFWRRGQWHFVQPYGQVGAQFNLARAVHPTLTGALMPVNIGYDVTDNLSVQFAAGVAAALDLATGVLTAGPQASFGVAVKFGRPKKK